jgi:formylglycine-generating enzyme required for sulfatase activity
LDANTNWRNPGFAQGDDHPVVVVSHNDAMAYVRWLHEARDGKTYALPTEAQWEYAARAGTVTPYYWGTALNGTQANCDGNHPYGTKKQGPYLERTTPVGTYARVAPHLWGLDDVIGNAWEWCQDWYDAGYYARSPAADPLCADGEQKYRVLRGGSWLDYARSCRAAYRSWYEPGDRNNVVGFRPVLHLD